MTSKTLDQEVIDKNDGLVSMGVVKEAPDGNLPVAVEGTMTDSLEDNPDKTITDGGLKDEIAILCHQAGIMEGYASKLDNMLNKIICEHDFIKGKGHYGRVRSSHVDYLFLSDFGPNKEKKTVGFSVKIEDNLDFIEKLYSCNNKLKYSPDDNSPNWPFGAAMVSACVGAIGGMILGTELDSSDIGFGTFFGCTGLGTAIGTYIVYHHNRVKEKIFKDFLEEYKTCMQSSNKPINLTILI